jgi:hypothetical protein
MPGGTTLAVSPTKPTGAVIPGGDGSYITLTDEAADIVTGVDDTAEANIAISYRLSATVAAGVLESDTRSVTVTIADAS